MFDDRLLVTLGARRQNIIVDGYDRNTLVRRTRSPQAIETREQLQFVHDFADARPV